MIVSQKKVTLLSSLHVQKMLKAVLESEDEIGREREHFWAIGLNAKNVVQFIELVHLGTANASLVHPREVYRWAVAKGCISIIVGHNHPSGDVAPSIEDRQITSKLKKAGDVLGIKLFDHVIISNGDDQYYSFNDQGVLHI